MNCCEYLRKGMQEVFKPYSINFRFVKSIEEVNICSNDIITVMLALDLSCNDSLIFFKQCIDFLNQINSRKKIGVLLNKNNLCLSYYIYKKLKGKVTFFNTHQICSGQFQRNVLSWLNGKTSSPMRVISRLQHNRYGLSLNEWISIIIPLSGESMQEISSCLKISVHTLYQNRKNALKKMNVCSYRKFCEQCINGEIHIGNDIFKQRI